MANHGQLFYGLDVKRPRQPLIEVGLDPLTGLCNRWVIMPAHTSHKHVTPKNIILLFNTVAVLHTTHSEGVLHQRDTECDNIHNTLVIDMAAGMVAVNLGVLR